MTAPVPDRNRKLLAINAFYHADQVGTGVTVLMEGDNLWNIADFICEEIAKFKATPVAASDSKQFLDYVRRPEALSDPMMQGDPVKLITAAAIGYLEEIGAIPSDEYNGLQYIYEPRVETLFGHVEGPMPGLTMMRDLPRRPGHFYLVLAWTDLRGQFAERKVARQVTTAYVEEAHNQFQDFLDDQYKEECERSGMEIDKEEFIVRMIPVTAERASELLSAAKSEDDLRIDAPAGRFACFLACWIVWQSPFQQEIGNPSLLTLAVHIRFREDGQFEPVVLADHGEGPKPVTLH